MAYGAFEISFAGILAGGVARQFPPRSRRSQPAKPSVTVFGGRAARPRVLIVSPYVPFPLSHGGAVRMYNLIRRAAESCDQILVAFTDTADPPPAELLDICSQVVLVRRAGSICNR